MRFETVTLSVRALEVCPRTRVRKQAPIAGSDIVIEYAEAYRAGLIVEPLDVFREKGTERYIVADGEHRLLALLRAKIAQVECRLYEGDEVDALDFAMGCNRHGLRRTREDLYFAFVRIMETPRLRKKYATDVGITDRLGISTATVTRYRAQWRDSEGGDASVRAKKEKARETAAKHTSRGKTVANPSRDEFDSSEKQDAQAFEAPQNHSHSPLWTPDDQASYEALCDAWKSATPAARKKFQAQSI